MTVQLVAVVCPTCLGDTTVAVERHGVEVEVPCPGCCCGICGATTDTPPECLACFCREDASAKRRADV